jgi:hypothetical protein
LTFLERTVFNFVVMLEPTTEKRLMIDLMAIREAYERSERSEFQWIEGFDNPADAMTKAKPNNALQTLVETNELRMKVAGSGRQ